MTEVTMGQLKESVDTLITATEELKEKVIVVCTQEASRDNLCGEHRRRIEAIEKRQTNGLVRCGERIFQRRNLWLQITYSAVVVALATVAGLGIGGVI